MAKLREDQHRLGVSQNFGFARAPAYELASRLKVASANPSASSGFSFNRDEIALAYEAIMFFLENMPQSHRQGDDVYRTGQAAELLNVSRPFLVKLLETGKIPFHKVGTHRRVRKRDLDAYKEKRNRESHRLLDELVAEAQELELEYD